MKGPRSSRRCDPSIRACLVRGQYVGYREEDGADKNSSIETFAAAKLEIDSWRWAGVPWYIRAGKGLAAAATE